SGVRSVEFTNATTTQCFDPQRRTWATDLLRRLGLPLHLFGSVVAPGTRLGPLRATVAEQTGLGALSVVAPATHDTASAVAAVPALHSTDGQWAFISSGTRAVRG